MENKREIIYGPNAILELLQGSKRPRLRKIIISDRRGDDKKIERIMRLAEKHSISVERQSSKGLIKICGTEKNQGIVGVAERKKMLSLDELLSIIPPIKHNPVLLAVDGVEDPGNLGAVLRSADALGINGIILPKRRNVGITPVVYKTSAGAAEHLPLATVSGIANSLPLLKKRGFWIIAADAEGKQSCHETDFLMPCVIVLGGEHKGVRKIIKDKSDIIVSIPMQGKVSSLNVSASAAILFYEILRQKQ